MLKIALSGSTGLIGSRIIELLKNDFIFAPLLQSQVDITNRDVTLKAIDGMEFDLFLHLAAYTNVDGAEKEKELVHKINVDGTRNVFDAVTSKKRGFIYISTDFVFDGTHPPYFEDSTPNPLSYYAKTKFEGEKIVKGQAMIIRLSYPYRARFDQKKDYVKSIVTALSEKKRLNMITDCKITPTFVDDIAFALKHCFTNFAPHIIHLIGSQSLSHYEAGKLIAKIFKLDESLIQATSYQDYYINKAHRPQYSEIKSKNNTFYIIKTFEKGLTEVANQLQNT